MQKVQLFLRSSQKAALKALAARTGRKQSDLIREGVDLLIAQRSSVDWRETLRAVAGLWKNRTDLESLSEDLRAAAKHRFSSVYERN